MIVRETGLLMKAIVWIRMRIQVHPLLEPHIRIKICQKFSQQTSVECTISILRPDVILVELFP